MNYFPKDTAPFNVTVLVRLEGWESTDIKAIRSNRGESKDEWLILRKTKSAIPSIRPVIDWRPSPTETYTFKFGDRVKFIEPVDAESKTKIYVVLRTEDYDYVGDNDMVILKNRKNDIGENEGWCSSRFTLVEQLITSYKDLSEAPIDKEVIVRCVGWPSVESIAVQASSRGNWYIIGRDGLGRKPVFSIMDWKEKED